VTVELTSKQARYLSILAAQDLRGSNPDSNVVRTIHLPAWEALQDACEWEDDP
jgi:hypothetical protein